MNHDKVQEITAEMRTLLNQQTLVMSNPATIPIVETPQPEMDAYQTRNDRLRELGEELNKLDGRIPRAYRFHSVWIIQIPSTPPRISSWIASHWRIGAAVARAVRIAVASRQSIETDQTAPTSPTEPKRKRVESADKILKLWTQRPFPVRYPSGRWWFRTIRDTASTWTLVRSTSCLASRRSRRLGSVGIGSCTPDL